MRRPLLVCSVIWALMMLSVPLHATSTVKRVALVGVTKPIPYPGNVLFTAGSTIVLYRISAYVQGTPDRSQTGAVALNVFCPSAIGTVQFQLGISPGNPACGGVSQTTYLAMPNASSSCIYWIDFDQVNDPVSLNVYLTVEKI